MSDSDGQGRRGVESDPTDASPVRRRSFLRVTGAGAVAATLAGCSSDDSGNGNGNGGDDDTATAENTPTEALVDISEPLSLGAFGVTDRPQGVATLRGVELAVEEINDGGGLGGFDVEMDTRERSGPFAEQAHGELASDEDIDATIGGTVRPSRSLQQMAGTIHLGIGDPMTPFPDGRYDYEDYKHWFRVSPRDGRSRAQTVADFVADSADDFGWERVAVLTESGGAFDAYDEHLIEEISDIVEVPVRERVSSVPDFSPFFNGIEEANCDVALVGLQFIDATLLKQWADQEREFGLGGFYESAESLSFLEEAGAPPTGTFWEAAATPTAAVTEKTVPFAEAYREKYGEAPTSAAFAAYDAVHVLRAAIERAETLDSDELAAALEEVSHTGTTGTVEFYGPDGEYPHDVKYGPETVSRTCFQWQDGDDGPEKRVLWPDDLREGDYQSPPWT